MLSTRCTTKQRTNSVSTFHYAASGGVQRHSALQEGLQALSNRNNPFLVEHVHRTDKCRNSLEISSKCFVEGGPFGKTLDLADYYVNLISREGEKL
jgi:hypothetical protein